MLSQLERFVDQGIIAFSYLQLSRQGIHSLFLSGTEDTSVICVKNKDWSSCLHEPCPAGYSNLLMFKVDPVIS